MKSVIKTNQRPIVSIQSSFKSQTQFALDLKPKSNPPVSKTQINLLDIQMLNKNQKPIYN